jgi:AraC family transcriptional regulator
MMLSAQNAGPAAHGLAAGRPPPKTDLSATWQLSEPRYVRSFSWGDIRAERAKRRPGDGALLLNHHVTCMTLSQEKKAIVTVDDGSQKSVMVPRHSFSFIPAGTKVNASRDHDFEYICVFQDDRLFREVMSSSDDQGQPGLRYMSSVTDPLVTQIVLAISQEASQKGENGRLFIDALSQTLASRIVQLQRDLPTPEQADATSLRAGFDLRRVTEHIGAYLMNDLTVGELAALVDMSPYSFSRAFKAQTGVSPYQYVVTRRIERAKALLADPTVSIADVAYHVGFSSQSHLTTVFSKTLGVTPKAFRESSF